MTLADDFLRALCETDVQGIIRLWHHVQPNLPQPKNEAEALISLHMARTAAISVPFRLRAYSHRWCVDNGLPSMLPDNLKPRAERIYPKIVSAVGIAVKPLNDALAPVAKALEGAMADAVAEAYADNRTEPAFVKSRMLEAYRRTAKQLR